MLTTEGDYMYSFGIKGVREGQFGCPWGLALDDRMRVIVADFKHSNIQVPLYRPQDNIIKDKLSILYNKF